MVFWVYLLRCADNSYYTGHTDDLEKRISEHQLGVCGGYTAQRLPVFALVAGMRYTRRGAGSGAAIKGWRRKKKEALIHADWPALSQLAKKKF